jgi:hypothetical protein
MWLDLSEDDSQPTAPDDDLAPTGADDVKTPQRLRQLRLVTRAWTLRQGPRHDGQRYTERVCGANYGQARRDRSL